jgi:nicotinamide-nucleotide amidase
VAMVEGALKQSRAGIAVSVTGIAGPGGGSIEKPVGLVHFAVALRSGAIADRSAQFGNLDRNAIRALAVEHALRLVAEQL